MQELQSTKFRALIQMYSSLTYGSMEYYKNLGLQYVDVPAIVGITGACENVDTLFRVGNRCGLPLFFTQTGQLALEQVLQGSHGVYTIINSGRDEELEDERHLRQFRLTEEEFDCASLGMTRESYDEEIMYEALLEHIESATKAMIRAVVDDNHSVLNSEFARNPSDLKSILSKPYLRVTYDEAIRMLQKNGFERIKFGDDLESRHEAKVVELLNKAELGSESTIETWSPVLIMKYPKEIKFFNMKVSTTDPRVVLSADCVFPYSGESVGAAVREHDGIKLLVRLLTSRMYRLHEARGGTYEDFQWYTEGMILAEKTLPHAGYGIGNERIMQFVLGVEDIREISILSLISAETKDWNSKGALEEVLIPVELSVDVD